MANGQNDLARQALEIVNRMKQERSAGQEALGVPPSTQEGRSEALVNFFQGIRNMATPSPGTVTDRESVWMTPEQQAATGQEISRQQEEMAVPMIDIPDQQLPTADASQFQAPPAPYSQADLEQKFMETAAMANRPQGIQTTPVGKEFQVLQEEMASLDKKPTGSTELERSLSLDPMQNLQEEVLARTQESLAALDNTTEKIQPGKFWSELPTWQKVVAGLSMALGSITPQGAANVQKIWSNAIDRDIDAQKANLNRKDNLFTKYYSVLKDMKAAELATRVAQLNQIQTKAMLLKEKAMTPLAQRNMALTNEALSQQIQENSIKLMQSIKRMKAMEALGQGQGPMDIRNLPPEWKPYAVQDFGISNRADSQSKPLEKEISDFRNLVAQTDVNNSNLLELREMLKDYAGKPSLLTQKMATDKEFAGKLRSYFGQLKLDILKQQKGPGSDRDLAVVENIVADPESIGRSVQAFMGSSLGLLENGSKLVIAKASQLGFGDIPERYKNFARGFYQEQFKRGR